MEDLSLAQFRDRGYQIVRDVIDDHTIELVRGFLEHAAKDALERIRHSLPFATIDQLLVKIDDNANVKLRVLRSSVTRILAKTDDKDSKDGGA